jgi:glyoxylase I family protein
MSSPSMPLRLHHSAFVVDDLEKTRRFYEDVVGLPLMATYCEEEEVVGKVRSYCHCFFSIADGGALAFFQFADEDDKKDFKESTPKSPFYHLALKCTADIQNAIHERLKGAGCGESIMLVDHGYCRSLYAADPDGMMLEFTVDSEDVDPKAPTFTAAHAELARWLSGDRRPNNSMRSH